jgi:hypothetical protein
MNDRTPLDPITDYALNRGPRLSQVVIENISVDDKVKAADGTIGFVTAERKAPGLYLVEVTTEAGLQHWYRLGHDELKKLPNSPPAPIKIYIS